MISFHGDHKLKADFLRHVEAHAANDQLRRATYGCYEQAYVIGVPGDLVWRGCAVSCGYRSLLLARGEPLPRSRVHYGAHNSYASGLGIPEVLVQLEDLLFEHVRDIDVALAWPLRFSRAIPVGADLRKVWNKLCLEFLTSPLYGLARDQSDEMIACIANTADLHRRILKGEEVPRAEWGDLSWDADSGISEIVHSMLWRPVGVADLGYRMIRPLAARTFGITPPGEDSFDGIVHIMNLLIKEIEACNAPNTSSPSGA